jgi:hypothetical protein
MATISASELERVISAMQDRRVSDFRKGRPHSSEFLANQRKLAERIKPLLTKGLELEKINKIVTDNENERRRLLEKEKADAYKRLPKIEDTFRHEIDERFKAFELANSADIGRPPIIVLDTPIFIHAYPRNTLTASHIEPRNNTAKIKYETEQEGDQIATVGFYFVWENLSPRPVLLANVASHLVIKGYWEVDASKFYLPGLHTSEVDVDVELDLLEHWTQPPTRVNTISTEGFGIRCDGFNALGTPPAQDSAYAWIMDSYDVKYSNSLAVPPKGVVLFGVVLRTRIFIIGGPCFASIFIYEGDSSVLCPFVQFEVTEVISGPPL